MSARAGATCVDREYEVVAEHLRVGRCRLRVWDTAEGRKRSALSSSSGNLLSGRRVYRQGRIPLREGRHPSLARQRGKLPCEVIGRQPIFILEG